MEEDHSPHNVVAYNEQFDTDMPKVHRGILWCKDCEKDFAPETDDGY